MIRRRLPAVVAMAVVALVLVRPAPRGYRPAAGPAPQSRQMPIIMYHSLLYDKAAAGDYVLSPDVLAQDMAWLAEHGYQPVLISDLAAFVAGEGDLPPHPVAITLDDGHLNNLTYLPALLEEYDFCATISVVGEYSQLYSRQPDPSPAYAYLTWDDIAALAGSGRIEIANHSYYAHSRIPAEEGKRRAYGDTLVADARDMNRALLEKSGVAARVYTYPYGLVIEGVDQRLRKLGFVASLGCTQAVNTVTVGEVEGLFSLGRFNRPSGVPTGEFMEKIMGGAGGLGYP